MTEREQSPQREIERKFVGLAKVSKIGFSVHEPPLAHEPPPTPEPKTPVAIVDGKAVSAIYEVGGHHVYNEGEKVLLEKRLNKKAKKLKPLDITPCDGVLYSSREEVVNHLKGITPESQVIPQLREQLRVAEEKLTRMEQGIESRLNKLEGR